MTNERDKRKKARTMLHKSGYKNGGHLGDTKRMIGEGVRQHEDHDHAGEKPTRLRLKDGGTAMGGKPKRRADKKARGHTTVNVVVGQHPKPQPVPVPVPVNAGGPPPGAGAPPPGPPMPPPDQGGLPPPGLKRGGRAKAAKTDSQRDKIKGAPMGQFKKGGHVKGYPISDGAGGAKGRLEKAKSYGA